MSGPQHRGMLGTADRPHVRPVGDQLERALLSAGLRRRHIFYRGLWSREAILPVRRLDRPWDSPRAGPLEGALGLTPTSAAQRCHVFTSATAVPWPQLQRERAAPSFSRGDPSVPRRSPVGTPASPIILLWGPQRQASQHLPCTSAPHGIASIYSYDKMP